jgi:hypothetical protein
MIDSNYDNFFFSETTTVIDQINQLYSTVHDTTDTVSNTVWKTIYKNYVPFRDQYVYDTGIQWWYTSDIKGLREYMFANNLYKELSDILYDLYLITTDEQDFEDSLYRNTLDLIYEFTRPEPAFDDLLNEDIFDYRSLNKIIDEVIEAYRNNFKTEEF